MIHEYNSQKIRQDITLRTEKLDEDMDFKGILLGFQHGVTTT